MPPLLRVVLLAKVVDSLYVIEMAMRHFYMRAEMGKNAGRKEALVDQDYKDAATLAAMAAPYRHARLSAVKLAGDPNNPVRFNEQCHRRRVTRGDYEADCDIAGCRPY